MKKNHLYIASALLSVMLVSGFAQAKTTETTAATQPAKTTQAAPVKGPMQAGPKLSEAGQKIMREAMAKEHESNKLVFDSMMAKQKELDEIMKAPTFDKEAFLAKEAELQTIRQQMAKSRSESFASVVAQLSVEDRTLLAQTRGPHPRMDGKGQKGMGMGKGMGMRSGCSAPEDCPMMGGASDNVPASDDAGKTKAAPVE